jgi:uracil-DNA glycosylase
VSTAVPAAGTTACPFGLPAWGRALADTLVPLLARGLVLACGRPLLAVARLAASTARPAVTKAGWPFIALAAGAAGAGAVLAGGAEADVTPAHAAAPASRKPAAASRAQIRPNRPTSRIKRHGSGTDTAVWGDRAYPCRTMSSFVAPGTGWPEDPATAATPVAGSAAEVTALAASAPDLAGLTARQSVCRACPRLVAWREEVATVRRRSFRDEPYWGRPVQGWGDPEASIVIVGLAPAAHGGNRTGRVFTGDRSGDFLFASLYRCGLASQPTSVTAGDGQRLTGARMAAAVRCAPPANKPTPGERARCSPWLAAELRLVSESLRVIVCLGGFAWQALWPVLGECGYQVPRPRPAFGHGAQARLAGSGGPLLLLGCYHPSQQNTFTGRVTAAMTDDIFLRARDAAGLS